MTDFGGYVFSQKRSVADVWHGPKYTSVRKPTDKNAKLRTYYLYTATGG